MRRCLLAAALLAAAGRAQEAGVDEWLSDVCAARPNADESFARLEAAGPQAFPKVLAELLEDRTDAVRLRLAKLLVGYAAAMPTTEPHAADLRRLVVARHPEVLGLLAPVFAKAGASLMPALEGLFASPDARVRAAAASALGTFGTPAFPLIRKNLGAASAFRCEAALLALASAGDAAKKFAPEVKPFLADKKPAVRSAAVSAYSAVTADRRAAARALVPLLDDPEPGVRQAAAQSLERHAAERVPELVAALSSSHGEGREVVTGILQRLPAAAGPAFTPLLLDAPASHRAALLDACSSLVAIEFDANVRGRIVAWASDPDLSTRVATVRLLGRGTWPDPEQALPILRAAASAPEPEMRVAALRSFAANAHMARALASDPDPVVRMEAACLLLACGEAGPDPLPLCLALLDQSPCAAERIGDLGARGLAAVPDLVRAAATPACGPAARRALTLILDAPPADAVIGRPVAVGKAPESIRTASSRALRWLAEAQEADGRWDGVRWGGAPHCDCGLTGLAVLAFLAAGHTDASGTHATTVRKALGYLVASQADDGCLPTRVTETFLIQHAIATTALAEAASVCRWNAIAPAAKGALNFVTICRNPNLGWRYLPRGGENDTFVTTWMVMALKAGEMAGLHRDPDAYRGALLWIDKLTEPNFGQVGYNYPGGQPACPKEPGGVATCTPPHPPLELPRGFPENAEARRRRLEAEEASAAYRQRMSTIRDVDINQACTAAGLWLRLLLGSDLSDEVECKGIDLIAEQRPTWNPGKLTIDECYWHWGALVSAQCNRPRYTRAKTDWRDALTSALLDHQAADGSWDPIGVWGRTGGRVFSTSTAVLALLAPYAYPEGCFTADYRRKLYPEAYKLLGR